MLKKHWILTSISLLFFIQSQAQRTVKPEVNELFSKGVQLVDSAQYDSSNVIFISLLKSKSVLPDEFCFYFGKSLCMTGHVNQSIAVLNKYTSLVGADNAHTNELAGLYAKLYHKEVIPDSLESESVDTIVNSVTTNPCTENHVCPICHGSKVRIEKTTMGNLYKTCSYCDSQGVMSCEDYKKYLSGKLERH